MLDGHVDDRAAQIDHGVQLVAQAVVDVVADDALFGVGGRGGGFSSI